MICTCGRYVDTTSGLIPAYRETDPSGAVIYEVCIHGCVVLDRRSKDAPRPPSGVAWTPTEGDGWVEVK